MDALAEAGGIARAERVMEGVRRSASFQLPPTEGVVRFLRRLDQRVVRVRTGRGEVWALGDRPVSQVPGIRALYIAMLRGFRAGLSLEQLTTIPLEKLPSPKEPPLNNLYALVLCGGVGEMV